MPGKKSAGSRLRFIVQATCGEPLKIRMARLVDSLYS